MKVLVYGSQGWIGKQFVSLLQENNVEFCRGFARVNVIEELKKEISLCNPTHIIAFIGRTHGPGYNTIDYLEQPGKLVENLRDNLYAQVTLANVCSSFRIHYTCIGTGCIFEYDEEHPVCKSFQEHDEPNFFGSSYSIVKGFTDMICTNTKTLC
jgi:dTDP-4-dehydrorhamnose reductase